VAVRYTEIRLSTTVSVPRSFFTSFDFSDSPSWLLLALEVRFSQPSGTIWETACLRQLASLSPRGFARRTSLHALSRAASTARFRLRAKRYGETSP